MDGFAQKLAQSMKTGDILTLQGQLGSGKTTFAKFFMGALGLRSQEVPSPTFTLVQTYPFSEFMVWHFDLYRLKDPEEVYELGIEEAFAEGVSLIEWPERLEGMLPREHLQIEIIIPEGGSMEEVRNVVLTGYQGWCQRLEKLFNNKEI
ncbi:MAG: tRNA (adenosine(37)-N6)-threonylcarbamoyltransferase complex ATPase subunit type 1 TsaE [Alphaproteobacteria bacterium]|nr:tRNA (adenosine(37)-N6)-threonylcarbamoyltransferase complex ATPase subunit type 1 TsaE [Alphaproteobacteria bacterium]MBT5390279.1 tRNA (adenosine(37)-N6)-threonylcarbamoyltransferase complex ATPase subunit type 1 TsaE [Alphaproteobacteria bacterium]MBT5540076.1 tRNA (adenosine(37)-N6)-threonylcarbamoyltransferase complex ATPase subunit type 1 TsaE [Alphaproteobacteria bacterium]MBT5654830.1 tRNA (adenosine(37)-N6)-threonylcarbamoyltransferase complex ATPase subunit type 1 TsaE [Alphaproteob